MVSHSYEARLKVKPGQTLKEKTKTVGKFGFWPVQFKRAEGAPWDASMAALSPIAPE